MATTTIRIALLLCDTPLPSVLERYGDYHQIYKDWLTLSLSRFPDNAGVKFVIDSYDVVNKQEYPSPESLRPGGYNVIMLTGSRHSAYDDTIPFTVPLRTFIKSIATQEETQHIQLIGICYGHQLISTALGGQCLPGQQGWEIGVYGNTVTEEGRRWWLPDGAGERVFIQQMHKDHVPAPPPGFQVLLSTPAYPVHSMVKLRPSSATPQIFTVQGHPEYTPDIVKLMIETRFAEGRIDEGTFKEAGRRAGGKDGSGGEGFDRVGWTIWRVILEGLQPRTGIDHVLNRAGPWTVEEFVGGSKARQVLQRDAKILVIGAGGLGCEILQNLALTGFADIHVIDMDTIDISNLNRQFLFRESDVGCSKAKAAAAFINDRVPGITVTPHHGKIQDFDHSFYMQFNIVIAGLDSVAARRWINATLVNMVDSEDENSLKPLIDGGTEGFKGQSRVILPTISACYECSIDMITPPTAFPICTIANTPRLPEHCIEWASVLQWPKLRKDLKLDTDDPDHIAWLYQEASARAAEFKIEGVTWALTQGVVKNIIPAIASTNAIIAASCCNEALKLVTTAAPYLNNYMMYTGDDSVYTFTFELEKKDDCPVCGGDTVKIEVGRDMTLADFLDQLRGERFKLSKPSISSDSRAIFWQEPPALYEATRRNLEVLISELIDSGSIWSVTDPALPAASLSLQIMIK